MIKKQTGSSNIDEPTLAKAEYNKDKEAFFDFTVIYPDGSRESFNALSLANAAAYGHPYSVFHGINDAIKKGIMEYVGRDTFRVNVVLPDHTVPF